MQLKIDSYAVLREGPHNGSRMKVPAGTNGVNMPTAVLNPDYDDGTDPPGYENFYYEFTGFDTLGGERVAVFTFAGKGR